MEEKAAGLPRQHQPSTRRGALQFNALLMLTAWCESSPRGRGRSATALPPPQTLAPSWQLSPGYPHFRSANYTVRVPTNHPRL